MKLKSIIFLAGLIAIYIGSKLLPWFTNVTYYIKHMSIFLLISFISYLIVGYVYNQINLKTKTDNQIRLNGILRVFTQGVLLVIIVFAQVRYVERKDTVELSHCEYYDANGNLLFESQYYFGCPEDTVIETTETSLKMSFFQKTEDVYITEYFYNSELGLEDNEYDVYGYMNFELSTTINITYTDLGYIETSETTHSLVANNLREETAVLTTKRILLDNTYIDGIYTSLKTSTTTFDVDHEFLHKPYHLTDEDTAKHYEYTYTTLSQEDDYDEVHVYIVNSNEFGNPLDGETPELLLSSKITKNSNGFTASIKSFDYFNIEMDIQEEYSRYAYDVIDMDAVYDWESVGNIPLLKKSRSYDNIGNIDYRVINKDAVIEVRENGNQVFYFRDYSDVFNQYPSLIKKTDYGYINEDYYTPNNNYFILEEAKEDETWEATFLKNFNLSRIDEIYAPDNFFNLNESSTLYHQLPYFYIYYKK